MKRIFVFLFVLQFMVIANAQDSKATAPQEAVFISDLLGPRRFSFSTDVELRPQRGAPSMLSAEIDALPNRTGLLVQPGEDPNGPGCVLTKTNPTEEPMVKISKNAAKWTIRHLDHYYAPLPQRTDSNKVPAYHDDFVLNNGDISLFLKCTHACTDSKSGIAKPSCQEIVPANTVDVLELLGIHLPTTAFDIHDHPVAAVPAAQ